MSTFCEDPIRMPAAPYSRMETGPVQFGSDWPGVFIRGDNAAGYALALGKALGLLAALDLKPSAEIELALLRGLKRVLESCRVLG